MNEKGTRIEISPDLHEMIKTVYNERKSTGDKEVTQKKILEELCKAGLEKTIPEANHSGKTEQAPPFSGIPPMFLQSGSYVLESKPKLKKMQEALYEKEEQLLKREKQLSEREVIVNDKFLTYLNEKEKNLGRENSSGDSYNDLLKFMDSRLNEKDEHIQELNDMIRKLKEELRDRDDKMLELLEKVERNTRHDIFKDIILPVLTPALLGLKFIQDSNAKNETEKQNAVDIISNVLNLTPTQKTKIINEIENASNTSGLSIKKTPASKKSGSGDKKQK